MKARISGSVIWPTRRRPEAVHGMGTSTPISLVMRKGPGPSRLSSPTFLLPRSAQSCAVRPGFRRQPVQRLGDPAMQDIRVVVGPAEEMHRSAKIYMAVLAHGLEHVRFEKAVDDLIGGRARSADHAREFTHLHRSPPLQQGLKQD